MNLTEAIEHASSMALPGFLSDDSSLNAERSTNEGALALLMDAWKTAPADSEPFSYDLIRDLADRNRVTCDTYGIERLNNIPGQSLSRRLSDKDLIRSVAALQQRDPTEVAKVAGPDLQDLGIAYLDAPIKGMVVGVDIETTAREPSRGYIVNVGLEFMKLTPKAKPEHPSLRIVACLPSTRKRGASGRNPPYQLERHRWSYPISKEQGASKGTVSNF